MALVAWRNKLDTAKALPSESERRDAFLALLREALTGRQVELSGTSVADHVDPVDNRPAPIVNFDMHLQEKKSFQANPAVSARSLATNFGYYFTAKRIPYVVIGHAARAREILETLSGADVESVSGLERFHDGWRVTVEAVEVRRIPESTDVLATYDVELDDDGDLVRYERRRRYARAQSDHGDGP